MNILRAYLNSLSVQEQNAFAARCSTTLGYLRKSLSTQPSFDVTLCVAIERESGGAVPCEDLRPDVDWAYLRGTSASEMSPHEVA